MRPMLERCVVKACHGEYLVDDIANMILKGDAIGVLWLVDGEPSLALAIEWVIYPQMRTANVMALGGKRLHFHAKRFWPMLLDALRQVGISYVECCCSKGMQKMLEKISFKETYRVLRLKL